MRYALIFLVCFCGCKASLSFNVTKDWAWESPDIHQPDLKTQVGVTFTDDNFPNGLKLKPMPHVGRRSDEVYEMLTRRDFLKSTSAVILLPSLPKNHRYFDLRQQQLCRAGKGSKECRYLVTHESGLHYCLKLRLMIVIDAEIRKAKDCMPANAPLGNYCEGIDPSIWF